MQGDRPILTLVSFVLVKKRNSKFWLAEKVVALMQFIKFGNNNVWQLNLKLNAFPKKKKKEEILQTFFLGKKLLL